MTQETYLEFFITSSILSAIPGPTATLVVHYALLYGKHAGKYTIPAVMLGDATSLTLAFTSIGLFLQLFPSAVAFIKTVGGIYIIYLGISSIFYKSQNTVDQHDITIMQPSIKNTFLHVYLVTAFNPKSIIFLLAFFPKYMDFDDNQLHQLLILGGTFVGLGGISVTLYDIMSINIREVLSNSVYKQRICYITGAVLVLIGIRISLQ